MLPFAGILIDHSTIKIDEQTYKMKINKVLTADTKETLLSAIHCFPQTVILVKTNLLTVN